MPKRAHEYQYSIRFNIEQLDLVSRLMARTGLGLVNVIRLALATLADKLGEPVRLPRAGEVQKKHLGSGHEPAQATTEPRTTDSDPELDLEF